MIERSIILVVTQDSALAQIVQQHLQPAYAAPPIVVTAANEAEARALWHTQPPDYVLLALQGSASKTYELMRMLQQNNGQHSLPIIIVADQCNEGAALQLTYQGAHDYVVSEGLTAAALQRALDNAREKASLLTPSPAQANRAERSLAEMLDSIGAGLLLVDREWRCQAINAGALQLLGGSRSAYLGRQIWDRYPQGTSSNLYRQRQALLNAQAGIVLEEYDPERQIWLDVSIDPVEAGFAIHLVDSSGRKQEQQRQEASERKLQTILRNLPDVVARFDRELRHVYISPAIERATGIAPEQMIGKTSRELGMDKAVCDAWEAQLEQVFASAENGQFEFVVPGAAGQQFYQSMLVPEYGHDGTVETVLCLAHDITASRTAQAALQLLADASIRLAGSLDYAETLQRIAEIAVPSLADWFSIELRNSDDDLVTRLAVTTTNPAGQALASRFENTRYPLNPAAPFGCGYVLSTGAAELWPAVPEVLLTSADYTDQQIQALRQLQIRSLINVPLIARERVFGVLSFATTSASERRFGESDLALAEELARRAAVAIDNAVLYEEAQQAIREREAFLSVASHELRNPLAGLIGRAELLQRRIRSQARFDERDQRDIVQIIQQAQRINAMLTDLLDRSVADTNQLEIHPARLDLNALVQQVVSEIKPALTNHGMIVQSVPEPVVISGDSVRLEQVIYNLISNAIKYSPSGSKITLTITTSQHWATLRITDQGIGIPADALPHIFKRFYRVANAVAQGYPGSGIGLYVVKDVITRHNGQVEVSSVEGGGSTFTVRLPLIREYAAHDSVLPQIISQGS